MIVNTFTRVLMRWLRCKRILSRVAAVAKRFYRLGRAFLGTPGQGRARWLLGVLVLTVPVMVFYRYTSDRLALAWRQWMTGQLVQRYFSHRAYYRLGSSETIDNPDQRIAEDVRFFTTDALGYLLVVVNSIVTLGAFVGVLWSITGQLMIGLFFYAGMGTLISVVIGHRLVGLYFQRYQTEADFRYGLVRVRDHAESIAFFHGRAELSRLYTAMANGRWRLHECRPWRRRIDKTN